MFDRLSIELTNRCSKGCSFCYNDSTTGGDTLWSPDEVVAFVNDCARHSVRAVSFGGGEPLEYAGVFDVLTHLKGVVFRSVTTNGLLLDGEALDQLIAASPDKVHISLHYPRSDVELRRIIRQVNTLELSGIATGVNLLVAQSQLDAAKNAAYQLTQAGLSPRQIVYLPMRGQDTPLATEVAGVASTDRFQSMSCLPACVASKRFCSIRWDKTVAWCSYTATKRCLRELSYAGLCAAMNGLGLENCDSSLVQLEAPVPTARRERIEVILGEHSSPMAVDYPAAHSMDTEWFATDNEGNVALLETGEPGLMPRVLGDTHGVEYFSMVDDVLLAADAKVAYDLDDFFELGPGTVLREADYNESPQVSLSTRRANIAAVTQISDADSKSEKTPGFISRVIEWSVGQVPLSRKTWHELHLDAVCWLRDDTVIAELPQTARRLFVGTQVAVWVSNCPAKLLRRLYDDGSVIGVMVESFYPAAHRFGFYVYACDDYSEGPYDRIAVPRRPIKIDELPESARLVSERVQFESVDFALTERLQPADFFPCFGWGGDYTDGET